ncbi:MAG: trehalose-phosphatase, partial [Desulfuromonadaceae bacterium]|nr:trehalose-phosphatase [Desulfuromonadaceae bacterium]
HAFDLDGTLAPIVADPAGIAIPDEVRRSMIQLNSMAPVAVITGRSRADALNHLGFIPHCLVGNHGAEGLPGEDAVDQGFVRLCQGWKEQLAALLPDMPTRGISLEDKGATIALHYRHAPDTVKARGDIQDAIACLMPAPRVVSGIFVENITPQDAPHKGAAVEILMGHLGCGRAIFVGDDVTDEDVFRLVNPSILGIRVGRYEESGAGYYLQGQFEMIRLLQKMIALHERNNHDVEKGGY